MHIAYVCSASEKRGPALQLYSELFAPKVKFTSSPIDDFKLRRNSQNRDSRLRRIERSLWPDYSEEAKTLKNHGYVGLHPRLAVLMLREGVDSAATHRSIPLLEAAADADLVLVVDPLMINAVRLRGVRTEIDTVNGFLGKGGVVEDVSYGPLGLFLDWQMHREKLFLQTMRGLASDIGSILR
jgi:hypothetical protein